jgi:hypothetical protein
MTGSTLSARASHRSESETSLGVSAQSPFAADTSLSSTTERRSRTETRRIETAASLDAAIRSPGETEK